MPLPSNGGSWPPNSMQSVFEKLNEWQAWWSGDVNGLSSVYKGRGRTRPSLSEKGVRGAWRGFWYGQPRSAGSSRERLHVPLAADICQASGDLLFAEPLSATVEGDEGLQGVLDDITQDGFHSMLATSAEIGAALGGTYLRLVWDKNVHPDRVFLDSVDPDYAVPEFRWGRLRSVTFYFVVQTRGQTVWRHAERHELDEFGVGVIYHGLYVGKVDDLGSLTDLSEVDATAGLEVDAEGKISTGTPGLAAAYVPNVLPNRAWRTHHVGRHLGRSDLDALEGLLDALDEAYGSWMRDIRLGKARIVASRALLDDHGPGAGASFDLDREVYEGVSTPPGSAREAGGLEIEQVQFEIRHEQHLATVKELTRVILRTAGYSSATFGDSGETSASTATDVRSRDRRTQLTRGRKERHFVTGLQRLLTKALATNSYLFGTASPGDAQVVVTFPNGAQDSQIEVSQTVQALHSAQAASTKVKVQMVHPDWDEATVDEEVEAIMREFTLADPDFVGRGGDDLSGQFTDNFDNLE